MHQHILAAVLATALVASGAEAKTFRYAYRVDPASLDPHALAETFTLSWLGQIYEPLVGRGKRLELVPALATSWEQPEPTVWRFHLRQGVAFSGGEPFTADDVIFSFTRAKMPGSDLAYTLASVTEIKKTDDFTVDLVMAKPNPILPQQITSTYIMSKHWAAAHGAEAPASIKASTASFASTNADGTGPYHIADRQSGVRTTLRASDGWWGHTSGMPDEVVFTPIESDATRVAALLSGQVDMAYPIPQQDVARVDASADAAMLKGSELRTMFLNMDQARDELLNSTVKGKNPFKDHRVREAIYRAIDMTAIRDRVMGGTSHIAGEMVAPGINGYDPELDTRMPFDPDASKKLLADAGYADGFGFTMDCSNDRYVNDERICQAIVGMLARVGLKVDLTAQTRTKFFEKALSRNISFAMLGWQPLTYDAHSTLQDTMSTPNGNIGTYNVGKFSDPRIDKLTEEVDIETDPAKRQALISQALALDKEDIGHIPLHQAGLAWGVRKTAHVILRSDDSLELRWVTVD